MNLIVKLKAEMSKITSRVLFRDKICDSLLASVGICLFLLANELLSSVDC